MEALIEKAPQLAAVLMGVGLVLAAWWKIAKLQIEEAKRRDAFDLARMAELERIGIGCHEHTNQLYERFAATLEHALSVISDNTTIIKENIKILGGLEKRMNGGK